MLKMLQVILELSGINCTDLYCSTCISGWGHTCGMQGFISPQLIITLHYCVIHIEHNGFLNNSSVLWKQLCSSASVWVFACLLLRAKNSTPPHTTLPAMDVQLTNCFQAVHLCFYVSVILKRTQQHKHIVEFWVEQSWAGFQKSVCHFNVTLNAKWTQFFAYHPYRWSGLSLFKHQICINIEAKEKHFLFCQTELLKFHFVCATRTKKLKILNTQTGTAKLIYFYWKNVPLPGLAPNCCS